MVFGLVVSKVLSSSFSVDEKLELFESIMDKTETYTFFLSVVV